MVRGLSAVVRKKSFGAPEKALRYHMNTAIHNRFDIEVVDSRTGQVRERAVGYNIILDGLWTYMLYSPPTTTYRALWFYGIKFGTGTGTLAASRTALFSQLGSKNFSSRTFTVDTAHFNDGWVSFRHNITLDAGEYDGETLREVGITNYNGGLMTHAVLEDMNGNPISITIGALDVVNIYATVFVRFEAGGFDGGNIRFPSAAGITENGWGILAAIAGALTTGSVSQRTLAYALGRIRAYDYSGIAIGYVDGYTAAVSVNPTAKKILVKYSDANGNRIGVSQLNPTGGGGWSKISFSAYEGGAVDNGIEVFFPNTAKPYCSITDEAVGTGDGETEVFALDFGNIPDDSSFVLKVDGETVDAGDYAVDFETLFASSTVFKYYMAVIEGNSLLISSTVSGTTAYVIVENPYYSIGVGVAQIVLGYCKIEVSNDLNNWTQIYVTYQGNQTHDVSSEYQLYRYWRFTKTSSTAGGITTVTPTSGVPRVVFDTAPAVGAVITASYRTASICKDTNHVVDLELEITLNEYTE